MLSSLKKITAQKRQSKTAKMGRPLLPKSYVRSFIAKLKSNDWESDASNGIPSPLAQIISNGCVNRFWEPLNRPDFEGGRGETRTRNPGM
jgi:hypothetical protein